MTSRTDQISRSNNLRYRAELVLMRSDSKIFVLAVLLFLGCRLWYLDYDLWNDEVYSVWIVRLDWSGLVGLLVKHITHPPLFYLLLKCWILVGGESLLWLRLFPVMIAVASVIPFYLLCRELRLGVLEVTLTLALMAVNAFLVTWAQNLRMYSLLLFFTLCSLWLFCKFLNSTSKETKWLLGLFAVNLCLVYTHYYGWLVIAAQSLYVLFCGRRKFLLFAVSVAGVIVCFAPWAYAVAQAAVDRIDKETLPLGWNASPPDWRGFVSHFATLNGLFLDNMRIAHLPAFLGTLLFSYPIFLWAWHINVKAPTEETHRADVATFWFLVAFALLPPLLAHGISEVSVRLFSRSFWLQRGLIVSAVPYLVLVAVSVSRLRPSWLRKATVLAVVGWAALAGFQGISREKTSWSFLIHHMARAEPPQSANIRVYALSSSFYTAMKFHLELAKEERFQIMQTARFDGSMAAANQVTKEFNSLDGEHFWIAVGESPWQQDKLETLKRSLISRGFQVGEGFVSGPQGKRAFLFPVWSASVSS